MLRPRRSEDLHRFAIHVKDNLARKPVDLLWQEYALGNTEHTAILIRGRVLKTYACDPPPPSPSPPHTHLPLPSPLMPPFSLLSP